MKFYRNLTRIILASCIFFSSACKKQDTTNNNTTTNNSPSPTGTLVFESLPQISTTVLGSATVIDRFNGECPSWTPDGRIIFETGNFIDPKYSDELIMIANVDGTNMTTLSDLGVTYVDASTNPRMSLDGKYFCYNFVNSLSQQTQGLRICKSSGTLITTIANVFDGYWAADGSLVAAGAIGDQAQPSGTFAPGTQGIFKISSDFKTIAQIGSGLTSPSSPGLSPDGKKVAFVMNNHIWSMNMDGTGLKQITTGANQETNPSFSSDGNWIGAYGNGAAGGNGYAIVPSNPATPASVTISDKVWVTDKNNSAVGIIEPTGNVSWK